MPHHADITLDYIAISINNTGQEGFDDTLLQEPLIALILLSLCLK